MGGERLRDEGFGRLGGLEVGEGEVEAGGSDEVGWIEETEVGPVGVVDDQPEQTTSERSARRVEERG